MSYDPKTIANEFIILAKRHGHELTPMKLQKLVYYTHGWHLAIRNSPLINEQVEAWPFGPVIPSLYYDLRHFGKEPVTSLATTYTLHDTGPDEGDFKFEEHTPVLEDDSEQAGFAASLIARVWEVYGGYTAIQLSNMTHENGSPWSQVYNEHGGKPPKGTDIPSNTIREYFVRLSTPNPES